MLGVGGQCAAALVFGGHSKLFTEGQWNSLTEGQSKPATEGQWKRLTEGQSKPLTDGQ